MNQELTTEQKARVFAQYYGAKVKTPHPWETDTQLSLDGFITGINEGVNVEVQHIEDNNAWEEPSIHDLNNAKFMLRPLSALTDADALDYARIVCWPEYRQWSNEEMIAMAKKDVGSGATYEHWSSAPSAIFLLQFFVQRGYAVPLFIAPGHPCNGMTAIEMGLAIDSTTR